MNAGGSSGRVTTVARGPAAVHLMRQGRPDFSVGPKLQTTWGVREGAVFCVEGVAATFMMLAAGARWLPGIVAGEIVMVLAVGLLFSHLGNPWAAWRAIANLRRSWISRGTAVIGGFVGLGAAAIFCAVAPLPFPLPPIIPTIIYWLQIVAAVFILFYPGFAMAASAGIPFWNTGLLPILSALSGLVSGYALALPFGATLAPPGIAPSMALTAELAGLVAIVVLLVALLSAAHRMGRSARLSGRRLITHEKLWFWLLACGCGLILPGLIYTLLLAMPDTTGAIALLAVAAAARISGDIALRYAILKVGAYEALL